MNSKSLTILLFVSVCLIWGTTWFAMEVALHSIPPIFATALRFSISRTFACGIGQSVQPTFAFP